MHLSLLSEPIVTQGVYAPVAPRPAVGRAHRDGVLRGLLFLVAISVPLCLAIVTGHARLVDASTGYAQSFDAGR